MKSYKKIIIFAVLCCLAITAFAYYKHIEHRQQRIQLVIKNEQDLKSRIQKMLETSSLDLSEKKPHSVLDQVENPDLIEAKSNAQLNSFQVLYFNTTLGELIGRTTSDHINIKYAWSELYNTPSEDFGGYWVGKVSFGGVTNKIINVSQSWSRTEIKIDGSVIYQGDSDIKIPFKFSAGEHLIEVKYFNNWHTTDFTVSFDSASDAEVLAAENTTLPIMKYSHGSSQLSLRKKKPEFNIEIGQLADQSLLHPPRLILVGLYQTGSPPTIVMLDKVEYPIILVLSSPASVQWLVKNPANNKILKIIHSPNTSVSLDGQSSTPIEVQEDIGLYRYGEETSCSCPGGLFHCEDMPIASAIRAIQEKTNILVDGYTIEYQATSVVAPKVKVEQSLNKLVASQAKYQREKAACEATASPKFNQLKDE